MVAIDRLGRLTQSNAIKNPCRVATTGNITLDGEQTIDGVSAVSGDRVLVWQQSDTTQNGIYVCDTGLWTRDVDFDGPGDVAQGTIVGVTQGTQYAQTVFQVTTASPVIGSALAFSLAGSSALSASAALTSTSSSSVAIASGSKSFTTQAAKAFAVGTVLILASSANPANFMSGDVTAYDSATGALTVNVTVTGGSGTHADWSISLSGPQGETGATGATGATGPQGPAGADGGGYTTGDLKLTWKTAADSGWIMLDDGSIGDASSGASNRANADTSSLYTLIWTNFSDTDAPVATGRGATAAADFGAHKKITLPKAMGYSIGVAGAGSGLTSRTLGHVVGEETHALTSGEMASHSHGGVITAVGSLGAGNNLADASGSGSISSTPSSTSGSTSGAGSGTAHNNMQPTQWYRLMCKL
jgi:hypothetical protein